MLNTDKSPSGGFELGFETASCEPLGAELERGLTGATFPGLWNGVVSGCHHDGVVVLTKGFRVVGLVVGREVDVDDGCGSGVSD